MCSGIFFSTQSLSVMAWQTVFSVMTKRTIFLKHMIPILIVSQNLDSEVLRVSNISKMALLMKYFTKRYSELIFMRHMPWEQILNGLIIQC